MSSPSNTTTTQKLHTAIITPGARLPLQTAQYPTIPPGPDEILIKVQWTSSSPLYLHQADGGFLIPNPPAVLGSSTTGTVIEVGPSQFSSNLKIGDQVFGFVPIQERKTKAHQEYVTAPGWCFGKIPSNMSPEAAVSVPENLVTIFNLMSADLSLPVPWPNPSPSSTSPPFLSSNSSSSSPAILIWGAASSCGQYALQLLRYYGYTNLVGVASEKHHKFLIEELGARKCFGYSDLEKTVEDLKKEGKEGFRYVVDCIGSLEGSVGPICEVVNYHAAAGKGRKNEEKKKDEEGNEGKETKTTVAILLPVITKRHGLEEKPEFSMDVEECAEWGDGVVAKGVRTHFYAKNEMFREKLQSEAVPWLLEQGIIRPNPYRIIEGKNMLERATNAMDELRKGVSGEKLVWRIADEE